MPATRGVATGVGRDGEWRRTVDILVQRPITAEATP